MEKYREYGDRLARIRATNQSPVPRAVFDTEASCSICSPGASGRGPARQLGRFYEMLLDGGKPLLDSQTVELLTARLAVGMRDVTFKHTIDWGLGFILNSAQYGPSVPYGFGPHASPRTFGHGGKQSSIAFADPEYGLAVVLIFNGMPGEEAHQRRMREALGAVYEDMGLAKT